MSYLLGRQARKGACTLKLDDKVYSSDVKQDSYLKTKTKTVTPKTKTKTKTVTLKTKTKTVTLKTKTKAVKNSTR